MNKQGPLKAALHKGGLKKTLYGSCTRCILKGIIALKLQRVLHFFCHYNNIPP